MTSTPFPSEPARNNTTLWAVVGVLSVAVVAMGAALIRIQSQPVEPRTVVLPAPSQSVSAPTSAEPVATVTMTPPATTTPSQQTQATKKPAAQIHQAPSTTKSISKNHASNGTQASPKPVQAAATEPAVAKTPGPLTPTQAICANCGTVQSVTPLERDGVATGVGAVAGGVLGAVVGNQVGGGDGKALATILGAVGGGMAGNTVEKKMKKVTHYEVTVRMDDGSTRTVQHPTLVSVGAQVTVNGNTLTPADR